MSKSTYIKHVNMLKPIELLSTSLCGGYDERTTDSLWKNKLRFSNFFFSSPSESTNKTKLNKQKNMTGASSEA
jgi:hypothetical protein